MNKIIKVIFSVVVIGVSIMSSFAQQDPMFTQYMFNTLSINPAYAGSRGALSLTALSRMQWVGIDGAPITNTLVAHTPVFKDKLGIGGTIVQDKIGPINQTFGYLDIAYHHRLSGKSKLSFGIKTGFTAYKINFNSLENIDNTKEPDLVNNGIQDMTPNVGVGVFYTSENLYFGLSAPKLISYDYESTSSLKAKQKKHYFATAGFLIDISYLVKFKPTVLVNAVEGLPAEYDVTANFLLHDLFWVGGVYRSNNGAGIILQYQISQQLRAGYGFEYPFSALNKQSNFAGSHEIMISYEFIFSEKGQFRSPRYF